jgi:hypothetical protein
VGQAFNVLVLSVLQAHSDFDSYLEVKLSNLSGGQEGEGDNKPLHACEPRQHFFKWIRTTIGYKEFGFADGVKISVAKSCPAAPALVETPEFVTD